MTTSSPTYLNHLARRLDRQSLTPVDSLAADALRQCAQRQEEPSIPAARIRELADEHLQRAEDEETWHHAFVSEVLMELAGEAGQCPSTSELARNIQRCTRKAINAIEPGQPINDSGTIIDLVAHVEALAQQIEGAHQ